MMSVITVEPGSDVRALNAALAGVEAEVLLLVDERSVPLGDWRSAADSLTTDLLGGVVRTYAGTRAGYLFDRSLDGGKRLRRQAVPSGVAIEVPNEGSLLIRSALLRSIGSLNESLPPELAILEFAVRAVERGYELRYDARLVIDRVAGALEPTLDEEALFAGLRTERQWEQLFRGPARRPERRRVDVIAHGSTDQRALKHWLEAASYPVSESVLSAESDPRKMIESALGYRDRSYALIDLRLEPRRDWLLELVETSASNRSVGITTCGESAQAYRILAADAAATLILNDRIPAQITLDGVGGSFDDLLSELSQKAASFGIVTRTAALRIDRKSEWRPRYLDAHTFESLLARPIPLGARVRRPTVSLILMSASSTGVHRFTTDALRAYSGEVEETLVVLRSDAPKIAARLRNQANVELFVDPDDELAGDALSRALAKARGDVIALMRDDYLVTEHWLEDLLAHLDRMPQAGIVAPLLSGVPGVQNCVTEVFADSVEFRHAMERRRRARAREARFVDFIQMPSLVMRRAVLEKVGDFDEKLAVSHYGVIDYSLRARTAGFGIALAEDVYLYHLPLEHSQSPFESEMGAEAYARRFATKWRLDADQIAAERFERCINSPLAQRYRFISPKLDERPSIRPDHERVVFLLPLLNEGHWQHGAAKVRKYLTAFTLEDPVTLSIGREAGLKTSVIAARIRKMIGERSLDEVTVPDIVISEANDAGAWLASLPVGPRYLLLPDARLPQVGLLEEISPSLLRRIIAEHREAGLAGLPVGVSE